MGRPPVGRVAMTGAERTRLYRLKHATAKPSAVAALAEANAIITALQKELAAAKAEPKINIDALRTHRANLAAGVALKAEVRRLKTTNKKLREEIQYLKLEVAAGPPEVGSMSFRTMSAIANVLHPDRKPTDADREHACKLFTAWKADKDKARRQAK